MAAARCTPRWGTRGNPSPSAVLAHLLGAIEMAAGRARFNCAPTLLSPCPDPRRWPAGCGQDPERPPRRRPASRSPPQETAPPGELDLEPPPARGDSSSPAVNSVTVDPGDGTIMVGTGPAMFIVDPGEKEGERSSAWSRRPGGTVSGNMVLRFTGPGELLANGHPRQGNLPENLPLLRSDDLGETLRSTEARRGRLPRARGLRRPHLRGHRRVAGHPGRRDGGKTWQTSTPPNLPIDIVVDPEDPDHWAVSTEQGTFVSTNGGQSWRPATPRSAPAWPGRGRRALQPRPQRPAPRQRGRRRELGGPRRRRRHSERNNDKRTKR